MRTPRFSIAAACSALIAAPAWARPACPTLPDNPDDLGDAELYIEFNAADEDLGVHGGLGADGWKAACLNDPDDRLILAIAPGHQLAAVGMADLFFEGREPPLDESSYDMLKAEFPEGEYRFEVTSLDGKGLIGWAEFSTVVPSMPVITTPGFVEDEAAAESSEPMAGDVVVSWEPVSTSIDGRTVAIVGYELILSPGGEDHPEGHLRTGLDIELGPKATSYSVREDLLSPRTPYEVEVLAVAEDHNQTIGIKWFMTP